MTFKTGCQSRWSFEFAWLRFADRLPTAAV
jgi:hypothetical protein